MAGKSLEAEFHKAIKGLLGKRDQGCVMGAYRTVHAPPPAPVPKCSCCGTTENLHRDLGSGGPFRCDSPYCMVY